MARFSAPKTSFLAGELSPKVYGHPDAPEYPKGARKLLNMIPNLQGDACMRPGTKFIAFGNSNFAGRPANARLIEFVYSKTESYVIAISPLSSEQGILIWRNDGTPCSWSFTPTTRSDYTYSAPSFLASELSEIQYAQSGDTLFVVHPNHRPFLIQRSTSTSFQIVPFDDVGKYNATSVVSARRQILQFPFLDANVRTDLSMTPGATSGGGVTLTCSAGYFFPSHVGTFFKVTQSGVTGVIFITGYTSYTQVTGTVMVPFTNTTASTDWREASWSDYRGWPRTVSFFEGRVIFGGTAYQPDTLWGSKVGNYFHMMADMLAQDWNADTSLLGFSGTSAAGQTVKATDPFIFTLASTEINAIQWLSATAGTLSIGTLGTEYVANGGQDRILSALNPSFVPQTNYGSAFVRAQKAGPATLFVSRDGKKIRDFSYDPTKGTFNSRELTLLADHLIRSDLVVLGSADPEVQILGMAYQSSRNIVWLLIQGLSTSRSLVGFTFDKDRGVVAFHQHLLGGRNKTWNSTTSTWIDCAPKVTGIAVLPNSSGTHDDLWLNVVRWVNGASSYTLEKMGIEFDGESFNLDYSNRNHVPLFLDCAGIGIGTPPSPLWNGLTWMKNETISVLADGKLHPQVTVDGTGAYSLTYAASQVVAGFPYVGRIELLPPEAGAVLGSVLGAKQRVDQVAIRFYGSCGAKMGQVGSSSLETISFVPTGQPLSQALVPFTGVKRLPFSGDYSEDFSFALVQDLPLPMNVSSITLRGLTNET